MDVSGWKGMNSKLSNQEYSAIPIDIKSKIPVILFPENNIKFKTDPQHEPEKF